MTDSINSLLDTTLDDLEDLPEFSPFPPGLHTVTISFSEKKIGTHPAVEIKMTAVETLELNNQDDKPLTKGATSSVAYMLDNEFGRGAFKKVAKSLQVSFPSARTIQEIMKEAEGAECKVITKLRKDKKDADKFYCDIVEIAAN